MSATARLPAPLSADVVKGDMFAALRPSPCPSLLLALGAWLAACGGTTQAPATAERPVLADGEVADAPNGIAFPAKYKNWPVLAVSQQADKQSVTIVVGNLEAVRAARKGQTNPWPDGSVLGHLVFEQSDMSTVPQAIEAGRFLRAEFMFKDVEAYASNNSGWGWARWDGPELTPYGSDGFESECLDCHQKVSGSDWLFAKPFTLP